MTILGLMLVLLALPMMSAIGGQNTISNVTGNDTPLDFVITTMQNESNPPIGANITYITSITISSRAYAKFNLTNFSLNLADNNTFNENQTFRLFNETAGMIGNETPDEFWIGQAAGQYSWLVFYGMTAFSNATAGSNGTRNATTWNLTWETMAPVTSTFLTSSRSGRAYTETWNITNENSNLTVTNASLVVAPSWYYTRVGAPTVSFNSTAFTTYSTNYTSLEGWTDLVLDGATSNMVKLGSGYATLSVVYNGPTTSSSSGSTPSATLSTIPEETKKGVSWFIIGLGIFVVLVVAIVLIGTRKR